MFEHTVIARHVNGIVAAKMKFTTDEPCGMKVAAAQEAKKLACKNLDVTDIHLSFLHGSTKTK